MATNPVDKFSQAEEDAHRLAEELARLKEETASYGTARAALDEAAKAVSGLANRSADVIGEMGPVLAALRSIGTPELLRAQEATTNELAALRQSLAATQQALTRAAGQLDALKEESGRQLANAKAALTTVRNLAIVSVVLSLIALILALVRA